MKNAIILFKDCQEEFDESYHKSIQKVFYDAILPLNTVQILSYDDDIAFTRSVRELKDTADNLIIVYSEKVTFDIKNVIAELFDTTLLENENAEKFLSAVSIKTGINYSFDNAVLPINSTLIPNIQGAFQGFMIDEEGFTLSVLPANIDEYFIMCTKYVIPYIENKYNIKNKKLTLKYIGDKIKLDQTLKLAEDNFGNFNYSIAERFGDYTINLLFTKENIDKSSNVVRHIVALLKDDIYAEFETTLSERLFDLLKLKNVKLSVAESFTGGRIASDLVSNSGISSYFLEGVVSYSNQSKMDRLGVKSDDLTRNGAVSSVVAYQMVAGLLRNPQCDLAIATRGIAGPSSDNTSKPVGLCYIAIGQRDGVHTYKYNLKGTREQITETAKNIALGLAIKILKKK